MKTLVSMFALALALAFTGPAFPEARQKQPTRPIAKKLAARGTLIRTSVQRKVAAIKRSFSHQLE